MSHTAPSELAEHSATKSTHPAMPAVNDAEPETSPASASSSHRPLTATEIYNAIDIYIESSNDLPGIQTLLKKALSLFGSALSCHQDTRLWAAYNVIRQSSKSIDAIQKASGVMTLSEQIAIQSAARFTEHLIPFLERQILEDRSMTDLNDETDMEKIDTTMEAYVSDGEDIEGTDTESTPSVSQGASRTPFTGAVPSGPPSNNTEASTSTARPVQRDHVQDGRMLNDHTAVNESWVRVVQQALLAMASSQTRKLLHPAILGLLSQDLITRTELENIAASFRGFLNNRETYKWRGVKRTGRTNIGSVAKKAAKIARDKLRARGELVDEHEEEEDYEEAPIPEPIAVDDNGILQWTEDDDVPLKAPGTPILRHSGTVTEPSHCKQTRSRFAKDRPIRPLPRRARRVSFPKHDIFLSMPSEKDKSFLWKTECKGLWAYFGDDEAFNATKFRAWTERSNSIEAGEGVHEAPASASSVTQPAQIASTSADPDVSMTDATETAEVQPQTSSASHPAENGPTRCKSIARAKRDELQASPRDWYQSLRHRKKKPDSVVADAAKTKAGIRSKETRKASEMGQKGKQLVKSENTTARR